MKYFNKFASLYVIASTFEAKNNLAIKANQLKLVDVVRNNLAKIPSEQLASACAQWFENTTVKAGGTLRDVLVEISAAHIVDDIITSKGLPNVVSTLEKGRTHYYSSELSDISINVATGLTEEESEIVRSQQEQFSRECDAISLNTVKEELSDFGVACKIVASVGQIVRYKRHLLTPEFIIIEGQWARDCLFHIIDILIKNGEATLKAKIAKCPVTFTLDPNNVELVINNP
jgi:hypothetical protein